MTDQAVALLGAGKMGAALVDRWVEAGRAVVVWNRNGATAQALVRDGVTAASTIAEAVRGRAVVVTSLTDGPALTSVLLDQGGLAALDPGTTLVDESVSAALKSDSRFYLKQIPTLSVRGYKRLRAFALEVDRRADEDEIEIPELPAMSDNSQRG